MVDTFLSNGDKIISNYKFIRESKNVGRWRKIQSGYPDGHGQIEKIQKQIEEEEKRNANKLR